MEYPKKERIKRLRKYCGDLFNLRSNNKARNWWNKVMEVKNEESNKETGVDQDLVESVRQNLWTDCGFSSETAHDVRSVDSEIRE